MPVDVLVKAESVARSQVGYREGTNNNNKYGVWFGFNHVAWCAIFLSWLSANSGLTYLGKPWRFASTIAARDHAKRNHRWTTTPTVGTYAMMAHTSTTGHVGFVIALLSGGRVVTIEGNTNDQGAREGNGVWLRTRTASSWDGYIVLDQTGSGSGEDMSAKAEQQVDEIHQILFNHQTPDGKSHNTQVESWQRLVNLEAVALRDIEVLKPLLVEVLNAVKADTSPASGGPGAVDADAFVDALAERLKG